jgi:hypothetical protein
METSRKCAISNSAIGISRVCVDVEQGAELMINQANPSHEKNAAT